MIVQNEKYVNLEISFSQFKCENIYKKNYNATTKI